MKSSKRSKDTDSPRRFVGRLVAIFAVFFAINYAVTFVAEPCSDVTSLRWINYYMHQNDSYDTFMFGSSYCLDGFDPYAYDNTLHSSTFDMSNVGLSMGDSYQTLKTTLKQHHGIKRVYFGVLEESFNATGYLETSLLNLQGKLYKDSPKDAAVDISRYFNNPNFRDNPKSLSFFFPWAVVDVDHTPSALIHNTIKRATNSPEDLVQKNPYLSAKGITSSYDGTYNPDTRSVFVEQISRTDPPQFDEQNVHDIVAMGKLCQSQGVQFYLISMPVPPFMTMAYGASYRANMTHLRQQIEGVGGTFIDMNMAKQSLYAPQEDDFFNTEHLNHQGSKRFSSALATVQQKIDAGEDLSPYFYSYDNWDEYLKSITYLTMVNYSSTKTNGGYALHANAYCSPDLPIEYRYELKEDDGSYTVLRDWDASPDYFYAPKEGDNLVRVRGREAANPNGPNRSSEEALT